MTPILWMLLGAGVFSAGTQAERWLSRRRAQICFRCGGKIERKTRHLPDLPHPGYCIIEFLD